MSDPLRDRWPIKGLTKSLQVIEISNKVRDFDRLVEALELELAGAAETEVLADWRELPVTGRLQFGAKEHGEVVVDGRLATRITSVCQRCLRVFDWPLVAELRLQLAAAGSATTATDDYELWELDDDAVRPLDVVDEALVMALPFSARHDEDACNATETGGDVPATDKQMTTPFADLKARMEDEREN